MKNWKPYIEPSGGASPEQILLRLLPAWISHELSDSSYPVGAYPLYRLLCQAADSNLGTVDLVKMVTRWTHPQHPDGPPPGLHTITHVLDSADALERGGFLRRETTADGERWTVLELGDKRTIPDAQKGGAVK